jgi:hypothetical protein
MKKAIAIALLGVLAAGAALAQTAGTNTVERNGYYFNAKTGQQTNSDGHALTDDTDRDRDHILAPTLIYSGTIAGGAADTTDIVDLSTYRSVALLFQVASNSVNDWLRLAVNPRYNLAGMSDSLSLFSLPALANDDSTAVAGAALRTSVASSAACGAGEFPVTIRIATSDAAGVSLPQGKVVFLTVPSGFVWPARCSFRLRNIGREGTAVTPTIRVWVMGTAK